MGLVVRDDGWRIPDWLWERMEPLLPAPAASSVGLPSAARAEPRRDRRDPVGAQDGDAVERAQRDRRLLLLGRAPTLSGVGAGRRLPRVLAARPARLRRGGRDRLGLAGRRRCDDQGAAGRAEDRPQSH